MTKPGKTLPSLLAACALALIAVGCGVEASSDSSSGPTTPTLAGRLTTTTADTTTTEPDRTTTTSDERDTTTTRPDRPTTTRPSTSSTLPPALEDTFRDTLADSFKAAGLTETQAKCLANGYLEKFGTDVSPSTDQTKMLGLFTDCGITPSDLGGLSGN